MKKFHIFIDKTTLAPYNIKYVNIIHYSAFKEEQKMYNVNHSTIIDEDGAKRDTYGISYDNKNIKDISTDKNKIEELVTLCNSLSLSPIHINDIIEDFLVDFDI